MGTSLVEFADRLNEIMPVIAREFARQQAGELFKGQITLPQLLILDFLEKQGQQKMTQLALFMNVSTAAMTGTVDRLVRDGYALRIDDPGDRRIIKIKLTLKGSILIKKINQERRQMVLRVFGKLSETDRQNYLKIIMNIHRILTQDNK